MSAANPLSTIRKRRTRTLTPTTCRFIARPAVDLNVSSAEVLDALGPAAANASSAQQVYKRALARGLVQVRMFADDWVDEARSRGARKSKTRSRDIPSGGDALR